MASDDSFQEKFYKALGRLLLALQWVGVYYPPVQCKLRTIRIVYCYFMLIVLWFRNTGMAYIVLIYDITLLNKIWYFVACVTQVVSITAVMIKRQVFHNLIEDMKTHKEKLTQNTCKKWQEESMCLFYS